jgi:hypothetical protein
MTELAHRRNDDFDVPGLVRAIGTGLMSRARRVWRYIIDRPLV